MIKIFQISYSFISKEHKKKLFFFYILFFFTMLFETLSIGIFIPIFSNIIGNGANLNNYLPSFFLVENKTEELIVLISLLGLIFTIKTIFLSYASLKTQKFYFELNNFFSNLLYSIYIKKNFLFHINNNSSLLIRDINDVKFVVDFFKGLISLFAEILVLVAIIVIIVAYNPISSLIIFFCISFLGSIFFKVIQSKAKIWGSERQAFEEKRYFNLQMSFNEIRNIKLLNKESYFSKRFLDSNCNLAEVNYKHFFILSLPKFWMEWMVLTIIIALIFFLVNFGYNTNEIFALVGIYSIAAYRLVPSITRIMNSVQQIKFSVPVILKISEIINNQDIKSDKHNDKNISFEKELEIRNVNFSYNLAKKIIFENINLKVAAFSFNGIIGRSGVGKSTLVDILTGLLTPSSGEILVDGNNILKNLNSWRQKIAYVPQNVFLSDLSVRENIAFGEEKRIIDDQKIYRILKLTQLDNFVQNLKDGIETTVGEFGLQVSGGQRQRIGIARALYKNPQVIILDESTNSLDDDTEDEILKDIFKLKKNNITIFLISHEKKILKMCDNVFEIKNKNVLKI